MLTAITDEELVAKCKKELPGNTYSYEILVQRYMTQVYRIAYRVVGNQQEAEDIAQEVFIKLFNNIKKFEQQATFSSWLYRIALNSALDALDKIKRRPQTATPVKMAVSSNSTESEINLLDLQPSNMPGPEDSSLQAELRDCINRVLKSLEREQARLLVMRDFEDISYDEISKSVGAGLSAIKMRIHRARLSFQQIFSKLCGQSYWT